MDQQVVRRASVAVFVVFFANGWVFASWAARLPAVRDGLGLRPDQMGLLLLVAALGALVALPVSGLIVERVGVHRAIGGAAALYAVSMVAVAVGVQLGAAWLVVPALPFLGMAMGLWDAAMNLEGAVVEQRLGRTTMPRYHAGFSLGTVVAAGVAAVVAWLHVPLVAHLPVAVGLGLFAVVVALRLFLPESEPRFAARHECPAGVRRSSFTAWAEPRTVLIGLGVLGVALAEGAANDWLSLAVVDGLGTSHALGAVGFGLFVAAMTAVRFGGTALIDRLGRVTVLRAGALVALAGLGLFGLAGPVWLALVGAAAWGAGVALGFPVGMSAAADDPFRAPGRVAVVSTIGYTAFLAGPPVLGFLAQHVGYRHALLAVTVPVLLGMLLSGATAPLRARGTEQPATLEHASGTGARS
ncbi:MAG: MFS transporter [Micrococcales bacterium]|nr:MFS transporter [Micrococcales bacterium]